VINKEHFEEFIQQASKMIPDDLSRFKKDIETNLRTTLSASLSKMELVNREEFDIQTALLQRTRAKLDSLQKKLSELENQLQKTDPEK
jgi:BMFP domain-containing protein YqiC